MNIIMLSVSYTLCPHPKATLRFPWAAGEPPCAIALRSLTVAFPPTGVSGGFGMLCNMMIIGLLLFLITEIPLKYRLGNSVSNETLKMCLE